MMMRTRRTTTGKCAAKNLMSEGRDLPVLVNRAGAFFDVQLCHCRRYLFTTYNEYIYEN